MSQNISGGGIGWNSARLFQSLKYFLFPIPLCHYFVYRYILTIYLRVNYWRVTEPLEILLVLTTKIIHYFMLLFFSYSLPVSSHFLPYSFQTLLTIHAFYLNVIQRLVSYANNECTNIFYWILYLILQHLFINNFNVSLFLYFFACMCLCAYINYL